MADLFGMLQAASGSGGGEPDPNFNQTTLLLHGDGTNGAQNNTFLDSSTNNFTITRVGNVTQGSFSPYYDGWSNYFDGTNDYLQFADNIALDMESGDFTIEFWINFSSIAGYQTPYAKGYVSAGDLMLQTGNGNGRLVVYASGSVVITETGTATVGQWIHYALVRNGSTLTLYRDGTSSGSATNTTNFNTSSVLGIGGAASNGTKYSVNGYMSNVRVVKGTALYTSAFTPSTIPLTAVSGTSLLTCQSNRFVDNSSNAFAITVAGNTSVQPFSPFAPSAAYDPSVNGGSGYFDGTTDALTVPSSSDFAFGTGDFTIEFWGYFTNIDDLDTIYNISGVAGTAQIFFVSGKLRYNNYLVAGVLDTATTIPTNTWIHVALVRSSGTTKWYLNGVQDASVADSINWVNTGTLAIGRDTVYARDITGYLSDLRVVKGSAVYTSAFTPPTAPLSAVTDTKLLLNFQNAGIFDNTGKNVLETIGNAQIDTTTKKYGTGSIEFDGTGDTIRIDQKTAFNFGTGDFTIEFWANADALSGFPFWWGGYGYAESAFGIRLYLNYWQLARNSGSGSFVVYNGGTGETVNTGQWYHIAITRSSGTIYLWVDGVERVSFALTTDFKTAYGLYISGINPEANWTGAPLAEFDGFVDDLRITNGVARYTTTFTPPTAPFPDQ